MNLHTTIHLHNVAAGREADYAAWFDGPHRDDLTRLRGFRSADRYEVTPQQIMPDIPQPWRYLSVYEHDTATPEIDLPALAPLLAQARDAGLIDDSDESERIHSYAMYADWAFSPNHRPTSPSPGSASSSRISSPDAKRNIITGMTMCIPPKSPACRARSA